MRQAQSTTNLPAPMPFKAGKISEVFYSSFKSMKQIPVAPADLPPAARMGADMLKAAGRNVDAVRLEFSGQVFYLLDATATKKGARGPTPVALGLSDLKREAPYKIVWSSTGALLLVGSNANGKLRWTQH